eukprot:TRINITY_DN5709_c0_g1_i2.p1 TRINITY_DN5709_c0_g1~~TRINITY_DN5709_c0_g1_i2.p1  ORF type:complete len:297 (-),score=47.84 TRINITY_DN5709_c0_g1_i2:300-1190(-)
MIRRPPRSTLSSSSAASDVYKRQPMHCLRGCFDHMKRTTQHLKKLDPAQLAVALEARVYLDGDGPPLEQAHQTKVTVEEIDCLAASSVLTREGHRPAVLNMANEYNCGGGFERTRGSQEEYLFRNTTLVASLWPRRREDDQREWSGAEVLSERLEPIYPFGPTTGVYTKDVQVFGVHDEPARHPHQCGILSVAAQDLRSRSYNAGATFDADLTRSKFRTALRMAADNGHDAVVLGAIGCGAFKNDPTKVAQAFRELLEDEYRHVFAAVVFAIIKSERNLTAFESILRPLTECESHL